MGSMTSRTLATFSDARSKVELLPGTSSCGALSITGVLNSNNNSKKSEAALLASASKIKSTASSARKEKRKGSSGGGHSNFWVKYGLLLFFNSMEGKAIY